MTNLSWTLGSTTITRVVEVEVPIPGTQLLPEATPGALAAHASWLVPHFLDDQGNLNLSVHALVIESCGARILVDTCVGEKQIPGFEMLVVDENDRPVAAGTLGEVVARGPALMTGYWNQPEATAEAMRGGWMHTGDAGYLDEEGFLYLRDRMKDMIVSGGENIYPREVEVVLFEHSDIIDAAVIGVPDEQWGETVKAVVVLRDGAATDQEQIIDFCRDKLGGYKRPRSIDFVDALPRNPSGKVLKRQLREPYWKGQTRRVAGS